MKKLMKKLVAYMVITMLVIAGYSTNKMVANADGGYLEIIVNSIDDFNSISKKIKECSYDQVNITLNCDLKFNEADPTKNPNKCSIFNPISISNSKNENVCVKFYGGNHTISNLYIDSTDENTGLFKKLAASASDISLITKVNFKNCVVKSSKKYTGLVAGYAGCAVDIKNITMDNCSITGKDYVGSVIGFNAGSSDDDYNEIVITNGTVKGDDCVGGIAGCTNGYLTKCSFSGKVKGNNEVGGLVGLTDIMSGSISKCDFEGEVSGDSAVGGIAGKNDSDFEIDNCNVKLTGDGVKGDEFVGGVAGENLGNISNTTIDPAKVSGENNVGGVAGENKGTIDGCKVLSGTVDGEKYVGGIAGYNSDDDGNIINSQNDANVNGTKDVGGLVGYNNGNLEDSKNTGDVAGEDNVGGLAGENGGTISGCTSAGNVKGVTGVGGLVGENGEAGEETGNNIEGNITISGVLAAGSTGKDTGENDGVAKDNDTDGAKLEQYKISDPVNLEGVTISTNPTKGGYIIIDNIAGNEITGTAYENEGYEFTGWLKDGKLVSTDPTYTFPKEASKVVASFKEVEKSIDTPIVKPGEDIVGPDTDEKVSIFGVFFSCNPSDGGKIVLVSNNGNNVSVKAEVNPGYIFKGWLVDGKDAGKNATISFKANKTTNVVAQFEQDKNLKNGSEFTVGKYVYKVKNLSKKYAYVKCATTKNLTVINPAETVKFADVEFKVAGYAVRSFKGYTKATKMVIGSNMVYIGIDSFSGCTNLRTVKVKTKKLTKIYKKAFKNCKKLKSIDLSKNKKIKYIGASAFEGCKNLKTVKIGKVKYIYANAFKNDVKLSKITGLKSVKTIKKNAFYNCKKLKSVTVGKKTKVNSTAFKKCKGIKINKK